MVSAVCKLRNACSSLLFHLNGVSFLIRLNKDLVKAE